MNEQTAITNPNKPNKTRRFAAGALLAGAAVSGIALANRQVETSPPASSSRSIPVTANMPNYQETNQITLDTVPDSSDHTERGSTDTDNLVTLEDTSDSLGQEVNREIPSDEPR